MGEPISGVLSGDTQTAAEASAAGVAVAAPYEHARIQISLSLRCRWFDTRSTGDFFRKVQSRYFAFEQRRVINQELVGIKRGADMNERARQKPAMSNGSFVNYKYDSPGWLAQRSLALTELSIYLQTVYFIHDHDASARLGLSIVEINPSFIIGATLLIDQRDQRLRLNSITGDVLHAFHSFPSFRGPGYY